MSHKLTWKQYKLRTNLWLRIDFQSDQLRKFSGKQELTAFLLKWA